MKTIFNSPQLLLIVLPLYFLSACSFDEPVNNAPVISGTPVSVATEDSAYADASIAATDEDGDAISYSINGPEWLSIDSVTGVLSGTPLNAHVGNNSFTISATDAGGGTDTLALTITVSNINDTPVVVSPVPDQVVTFGFADYGLDLSVYLNDPDVADTPVYSVTSNSDSTTIGTSITGSMLTLSHLLSNSNVISITVRITDGASAVFVEDTFTVNFPPVYYSTGFYWNDYVKNDGADRFSASDTACDGTETGGYDACIHSGEVRFFDTGLTDACVGLTAADVLGAFDWVCDDSGATTVFYSSGLKEGVNLSDLIDFTATPIEWKNNQLVVTGGAGFTSISMKWWDNNIVEDNDGMLAGDAVPRDIYVVTVDPQATYVIDTSNVGLVIKPGMIMTGTAALDEVLISASAQNFLWIEGALDVTGDDYAINFSSVKFSVIRNITADNSGFMGIAVLSSENNILQDLNINRTTVTAVWISLSMDNTIMDVIVNDCGNGIFISSLSDNNTVKRLFVANSNKGVSFVTSSDNRLEELVFNNNNIGIDLGINSNANIFSGVTASNNNTGINIVRSKDNILSGLTSASNLSAGVSITILAENNVLLGATIANNGNGVSVGAGSNNTLTRFAITNNNSHGVSIFTQLSTTSDNNIFSNLTVTDNAAYGVQLIGGASSNVFTGLLQVGNNATADCYVDAESVSSGGIGDDTGGVDLTHDGICLQVAPSDFGAATTGVSLASSFVGKVTFDDMANADDVNGTVDFPLDPLLFDWGNFDNYYRGWGQDGSVFPNIDNRTRWFSGAGRIWDWSLDSTDTVIRNTLALPTGNDTLTHTWSDTTATTFLRHAVEISDDGIGNDNLLCESSEDCLYTPNMGSYQGHGALISAGAFVDGAITGVTLWKYATNGY